MTTSYNPDNQDVFRAWINQPSTLQKFHKYHGQRVIVYRRRHGRTGYIEYRAYLVAGNVVSFQVDPLALSAGWPE